MMKLEIRIGTFDFGIIILNKKQNNAFTKDGEL